MILDHSILIKKLRMYGFKRTFLGLLASYLANSSQVVNMKGDKSAPVKIVSGVCQGSILGLVLCGLFINDLFTAVTFCMILSYADDSKLFHKIECIEDAMDLQLDLVAVGAWLRLNVGKCTVL